MFPKIGDVWQEVREDELFSAYMVVAIHEGSIILGGNQDVFWSEFSDSRKWKYLYTVMIEKREEHK